MTTDEDYRVYLIDLPTDVRGAIRIDEDGFASIYINCRLSYVEQARALRHELRHLRRDDIYNMRSIRCVERARTRKHRRRSRTS